MPTDQNTRELLLKAGQKLFADNGFDGTSIRDLATAAGVNIAAVNYHFQSKDKLYEEVAMRSMGAKRDAVIAALDELMETSEGQPTLEETIRTFVDAHIRDTLTTAHGPNLMRLMARELNTPLVPMETLLRELAAPVFVAFSRAMLSARPRLSPENVGWIQFTVISQVVHYAIMWLRHQPNGESVVSPMPLHFTSQEDFIQRIVDHITVFSTGGVEAMLAAGDVSGEKEN